MANLVSQSSGHEDRKRLTSLALARASLLASIGRSNAYGLHFLQYFVEVGSGTARGGESGDGGEQFHVDLDGRSMTLAGLRSFVLEKPWRHSYIHLAWT